MARGWESKSVEAQQVEDASEKGRNAELTPEERERKKKLAGLELSRRRVLQELATASSALRRTSLEQALAFLDQEIEALR